MHSLKEQRLIIISSLSVMDKGVSAAPAVKISQDEMDSLEGMPKDGLQDGKVAFFLLPKIEHWLSNQELVRFEGD